jgi:hypothetical protein
MDFVRPEEAEGAYMLCPNSSEPLRSDGCVIFSHSDLRPHPASPKSRGFGGGAALAAEGVKTKLARTRGENLIRAVPPDLPSHEGISWTDNGVIRLAYLLADHAASFLPHAHEWFSVTFLEEALNLSPLLPVRKLATYSSRSLRFYLFDYLVPLLLTLWAR